MTERILYLDCFSGLAGDMLLGALIDLGIDVNALNAALATLPIDDWRLEVGEKRDRGIRATNVHVVVGGQIEGPGEIAPPPASGHGYHFDEIVRVIEGGTLPSPVVERARAAFEAVATAEATVHGVPRDRMHFHEVGAVDSIVDIVGTAWGLWSLGVSRLECAPPPLGRGFVRCDHGRLPLPAPATLEILRGIAVTDDPLERELVTPTGAAFIKTWAARVGGFPEMIVERIGWGAGDMDLPDRPNLLRAVLGRRASAETRCTVIEANLDDLNPELAGYLMERLFEAGARDAWFAPVQMKKSRPGFVLGVLADDAHRAAVEEVVLIESSAIGLRRTPVTRHVLDRAVETIMTPFGAVGVKVARRDGRVVNAAPEYEDCARVARAAEVPLKRVYQHALAAFFTADGAATETP